MPSRHRPAGPLLAPYLNLKLLAKADLGSKAVSDQLLELTGISLLFLKDECSIVQLISRVSGKKYISFVKQTDPNILSRPVNVALFVPDIQELQVQWNSRIWADRSRQPTEIDRLLYTMAMSYCVAADLFDKANKKGPATYFEYLIGHLMTQELGVNPTKKARLPIGKRDVLMTMDFIFDLGGNNPKVHLPVKLSTRERVVQAWAHQRLLDAAFGDAQFRGILVVFAETKLDQKTREVVEICVPEQWLAYQTLLARMDRIYYFDVPKRYADLAVAFPIIRLKQFGEFFTEKEEVLSAQLALL